MDNNELLSEISKMMETHMKKTKQLLDEQTLLINLKIENDVKKRLDSFFDGYRMTHEKQCELEEKIVTLEKRIEQLEVTA